MLLRAVANPRGVCLCVVQSVSSSALRMVSVGQAAPEFKLKDQKGKLVSLSSFKNKKNVVVSAEVDADVFS